MSLRIARVFGCSEDAFLKMQRTWDLQQAKVAGGVHETLQRIRAA